MRLRCVLALFSALTAQAAIDFLRDVQPVLTDKCLSCHSGDSAQGGLRLHTREELLKGGKSGPAITPGKGAESLLVLKLQGHRGLRMPPAGPPLAAATIERIREWIDAGASFDGAKILSERIARLAPRTPSLPGGSESNPIDRFINAYFAQRKLSRPQIVSDARFARRAAYDITGLPLPPERLAEFDKDRSPDKRFALVDRLLADRTAYAEHQMSFLNDLLRNDEGVIYHGERKSITRWLYDALAKNLPYNVMVQQLLNPPKGSEAEGFLTGVTWRGVVSASQSPPMQAAQNSAQVFLGMNLKCAACHDSFINRWKLKDTFGLAAMFASEQLELVRCDVPLGTKAEARFPIAELKVDFASTLDARRKAAAEWFTHPQNGRLARTLVNRYWKQLFGRALVEPVDDMDSEPWHEDLLDWLASDFASNGYDLQRLIRLIVTSNAYQYEATPVREPATQYVFRGPTLRRLTAEQIEDTLSAVTGDWRVDNPRTNNFARYTRAWRLKSDPLSRALGRPIRDQVYTERSSAASTLQALELTNGPLLSQRLERGAKALLGVLPPPPANLFDSKLRRSGSVMVDVDITGADELWLLVEDVDSYDPARVVAGWSDAELIGPAGSLVLSNIARVKLSEPQRIGIQGKGYTRFRAKASIDDRSTTSDIGPAVRFFVFNQPPDRDRLVRIEGKPPYAPPAMKWTAPALADRLYTHLLGRAPLPAERKIAQSMLPSQQGTEDLLWALLVHPEFQYIH